MGGRYPPTRLAVMLIPQMPDAYMLYLIVNVTYDNNDIKHNAKIGIIKRGDNFLTFLCSLDGMLAWVPACDAAFLVVTMLQSGQAAVDSYLRKSPVMWSTS